MADTSLVPTEPKAGLDATEPSRITGAVIAVVQGVFALLTTLGITYEADLPRNIASLIVALVTLGALLFPLIQAEIVRGKVYAPASVAVAKADPPQMPAVTEPETPAATAVTTTEPAAA